MVNPSGLNYRRGIVAASIAGLILSVTASSRSSSPVWTFLTLIAASAVGASIAILIMYGARRPANPDAQGFVYGGFWIRFAAYIIDMLTIGIPVAVLTALDPSLIVLAYVVPPVYFVVTWATTGRTFGMTLCGLRVVRSTDGGRVNLGSAMVRLVGLIVAAVPLEAGLVWAAFDERKRGWHDMIAGTMVIRETGWRRPEQFG